MPGAFAFLAGFPVSVFLLTPAPPLPYIPDVMNMSANTVLFAFVAASRWWWSCAYTETGALDGR